MSRSIEEIIKKRQGNEPLSPEETETLLQSLLESRGAVEERLRNMERESVVHSSQERTEVGRGRDPPVSPRPGPARRPEQSPPETPFEKQYRRDPRRQSFYQHDEVEGRGHLESRRLTLGPLNE